MNDLNKPFWEHFAWAAIILGSIAVALTEAIKLTLYLVIS